MFIYTVPFLVLTELERQVAETTARISVLEAQIRNELTNAERHVCPCRSGRTGQHDPGSFISLLSEDEEDARSMSPDIDFDAMFHPRKFFDASVTGKEVADRLLSGKYTYRDAEHERRARERRERRERRRSLRESGSSSQRERSRSRSPIRQDRDNSVAGSSSCETRTRASGRPLPRLIRPPIPFTAPPCTPGTSASTSACGTSSDSSVARTPPKRRRSKRTVIEGSSSMGSPTVEVEASTSDVPAVTDVSDDSAPVPDPPSSVDTPMAPTLVHPGTYLHHHGIPELAVFFTPPGTDAVSAYIGDSRVHEWLQRTIQAQAPNASSNHDGSSPSTSSQ